MTEEIYDPFNTIETAEERKKRIQSVLNKAERILKWVDPATCEHFFEPEKTMYYEILARNPRNFDDVRINLYESYVCKKCGIGYYKLYVTKADGIKKPLRSKVSVLKAMGLINVHQRGEPRLEKEEKEKFGT